MPLPSPRPAVAGRAVDVEALLAAIQIGARDRRTGTDRRLPVRPCRSSAARPRRGVRARRCLRPAAAPSAPSAKTGARLRAGRSAARRACPDGSRRPRAASRRPTPARAEQAAPECPDLRMSLFNGHHLTRVEPAEKRARLRPGRTSGSAASIARKNLSWLARSNRGTLNTGMIRLRQPVQHDHADARRERAEQNRRLERRRNERHPRVERPAADVHRITR